MREGTTYGNGWMHRTLIALLRHVNIKCLYVFMAVFVIPFTLIFSAGARITFRYYHEKKGRGRLQSLWDTYRNHVLFGQTVIDKFAMYAGHHFKVRYVGLDAYDRQTHQPDAMVQLSAHIGCSEIVGYSYDNCKPSNVLAFGGEKAELMNYRKAAFGNKQIRLIPVGTDDNHSEDIIRALDRGEIVYAFADRVMNVHKTVTSTLHGHPILLARGPLALAVTRGLTVFMTSAMKQKDGSYVAYLTPLAYDKTLSLREQRQQLADAYMAEVERLLEQYPLQWFNYGGRF